MLWWHEDTQRPLGNRLYTKLMVTSVICSQLKLPMLTGCDTMYIMYMYIIQAYSRVISINFLFYQSDTIPFGATHVGYLHAGR